MPTYQYACTECGEQLEAVQKFSDPALTTCPNCQGKLRKVFNSVGIVFKGSGFYRNDSRSGTTGAEKPAAESSSSSSTAEKSSSSEKSSTPAKTESKPAAKSESTSSTTKTPAASS